jgi:hypothetical protein
MNRNLASRIFVSSCLCALLGARAIAAAPSAQVAPPVAKGDSAEHSRANGEHAPDGSALERDYDELDKAYRSSRRAAADDLDARQRAGEKTDDAALKRIASDYWPRFQALSEKGSGHARLWMALAMQDAFAERDRATNQKEALKLLDDVAANFADEPWIGELAKNLTALYIMLPEADVDRVVDALAEKTHSKEVAAEALYRSAAYDKTSKRPGAVERADDLAKRLERDYADTQFAKKLHGDAPRATGLSVGNLAPDFTTKDADGVEFKLSDYRGKVVVLDFWGFW